MTNPASEIIGLFGGISRMARTLSVPVSTVQGWKERKRIPQDRWESIMSVGRENEITIGVGDFLPATVTQDGTLISPTGTSTPARPDRRAQA